MSTIETARVATAVPAGTGSNPSGPCAIIWDRSDRREAEQSMSLDLDRYVPAALLAAGPAGRAMDRPPNVVIRSTDDPGYGDVGTFGAKEFLTPSLGGTGHWEL